MGCGTGNARVCINRKTTVGDTDKLIFLRKQSDDIMLDWIEDGTKRADRGKDSHVVHGGACKHGDLMGILKNYAMVLLGGKDVAS